MEEIKQGYKKTDIGVIPEDWEIKMISEISRPVRGGSPRPAGSTRYFNGNFIPWLTVASLTNVPVSQIIITNTESSLTEEGSFLSRVLEKETLIIANSGATLGVAKILGIKCCANDGIAALLNIDDNYNKLHIVYHINNITELLRKSIATGNGQPNLNTELIGNLRFPFPRKIQEQTAIATTLSDTDALIAALDKKIAKKQQIKQGAMQQLLTGKKRLPGFNGKWIEKKLGELCNIFGRIGFRGYTKNDLVAKGYGAITFSPSDIHNFKLRLSNCTYISLKKYEESPEIKVFNGDVIFVKTASIGKCTIINALNEKATINPQFVVLKYFKCDNYFLYYKLIHDDFQNQVQTITGGSTIPTMSQEKLADMKLSLPESTSEQIAISKILTDMDNEIAKLEKERDKYVQLKAGMMQVLLTGKVRLV